MMKRKPPRPRIVAAPPARITFITAALYLPVDGE